MFGGPSRKPSMHEIDLGPDPSKRRQTELQLRRKASQQDNAWNKCWEWLGQKTKPLFQTLCSVPCLTIVIIVLVLVFFMPYLQDTINTILSWSDPTIRNNMCRSLVLRFLGVH